MSFGRRDAGYVTRPEHEDLKYQVNKLGVAMDRITWLLIATLAATCADLARSIWH